jgi:hypothetical protein
VIFYAIYNFQQTALTVGVTFLQLGPWKELKVRNSAPMAAGRHELANSGEAGGALARERGGGGSRGHLGPVWALVWSGGAAGCGRRRHTAAAAAAASPAARFGPVRRGERLGGFLRG